MRVQCVLDHPLQIIPVNNLSVDKQLQERGIEPTHQEIATTFARLGEVHVLFRREKSQTYQMQDVYYFCTPWYLVRCVFAINESREYVIKLINLDPVSKLYKLPDWMAIPVRPSEWRIGQPARDEHQQASSWTQHLTEQLRAVFGQYGTLLQQDITPEAMFNQEQQEFLNRVQQLIDLTREHERAKVLREPTIAFTAYVATDVERVARQVYSFQISGRCPFKERDNVRVGWGNLDVEALQEQGFPGQVLGIEPGTITIEFRRVDLRGAATYGLIGKNFSQTQYQTQERAIKMLREGTAHNPHLLDVLVGNRYAAFVEPEQERAVGEPESKIVNLNASQERVARCVPAIPDAFLVLGPPGTGKTTVITEIVKDLKRQRKRVLVTSKNNKAVDNVLERLARIDGIHAVRVGREGTIAPSVAHLQLEAQARTLQETIINATQAHHQALIEAEQRLNEIGLDLNGLRADLQRLAMLHSDREQVAHAVARAQQQAQDWWIARLDEAWKQLDEQRVTLTVLVAASNQANTRLHRTLYLCRLPLLGAFFARQLPAVQRKAEQAFSQVAIIRQAFDTGTHAYLVQVQQYQQGARGSASVLAAKRTLRTLDTRIQHMQRAIEQRAAIIHSRLGTLPLPLPQAPGNSVPALQGYLEHLGAIRELLNARAQLMRDWQIFLRERRESLFMALLRAADVVGATCISIASNQHSRDLEFDVVIADEAGQIQVFDLLVPLVRGRTAILVGDHRQLPPMVDTDLQQRASDVDTATQDLLNKSMFELLFEPAPSTHKSMLNEQNRMPASIAGFISKQFYEGNYHSPTRLQHDPADNPFFKRAFCMIDTEHQPQYAERKTSGDEEAGVTGYDNPGEAKLLAQLAEAYFRKGYTADKSPHDPNARDIGIIVPYKRQIDLIKHELRQRALPEKIVASVDAFQGNERDTILFGFTRSNQTSQIGFLRELRRLNVILTRARRQMVIIGDIPTLRNARDDEFRACIRNLIDYLTQYGQIIPAANIHQYLSVD